MKTKLVLNSQVHPQEMAIPETLEIHPSVSPKAAALLEGVIEVLMIRPKTYNQNNAVHDCGSPCCITGHMFALAGLPSGDEGKSHLIGLTESQFSSIFLYTSWPNYVPNVTENATPVRAIARIEHFLKTGA